MIPPRVRLHVASAAALASLVLAGGCSGSSPGPQPVTPQSSPTPYPSSGAPDASAASVEDVVDSLEERVAVYDGIVTGVVVLVRVGEETAVVTGGRSDVEHRTDMSADLTWPIASITKMMTATLVLQLVQEGRLALDDDVRRWLPELEAAGPLTVEQLLSHRSGLLRDLRESQLERVGFANTEGILRLAGEHGPDFPPGTEGRYSNVGYAALGVLVARVLGQPLGQALQERVFEPAGMTSSALGGRPGMTGYADSEPIGRFYLDYVPAAGSVVSTAQDLDAFLQALRTGALLDPGLVTDMRRTRGLVQVSPFLKVDYGLGVMHDSVTCGDTVGHSGRIGGFTDEAWTLEDGSRSVVVTVNDQDADSPVKSIVETALCG